MRLSTRVVRLCKSITKWLFIITFCIVVTGGALALSFFYHLFIYPFDNAKFDKITWIQADEAESDWAHSVKDNQCIKGGMVGDLKRHYLIPGITSKHEVIDLLENSGNPNTYRGKQNCLSYNLGMCSGFRIDYDTLDICFDENNKVKRVFWVQH